MKYFKKSQITLFIIVAIVIIVLFAVTFIVSSRIGREQFNTARIRISDVDTSLNQFNSYIETCLSNALDEGLYILGRQGGFFFENQKGSVIDFIINATPSLGCFNISDDYNITYIIDSRVSPLMISGSGYPCLRNDVGAEWGSSLKGEDCIRNYSHYMPNIDQLPWGSYQRIFNGPITDLKVPLCSVEQTVNQAGVLIPTCRPSDFSSLNKYSIQNQLEVYIRYKLDECYDEALGFITDYLEAEVAHKGEFDVSVIFGDSHTAVSLDFPLVLEFPKTESISKSFQFYTQSNVRFKTIYYLLYGGNIFFANPLTGLFSRNIAREGIIDYDIFNLTYDIEQDSLAMLNRLNIFNISIERCYDEEGSIIRIQDKSSDLFTKPYEYFIRIPNRRPTLDRVKQNPSGNYDIFTYEGTTLIIAPLAFDLDDGGKIDQELIYTYSLSPFDNWIWRQDYFHNNSLYLTGRDDKYECVHPKYGVTKFRCTRIELNNSDVGNHSITVMVEDSNGLQDSQRVRLMVDNEINLSYTIENIYGLGPTLALGSSPRYIVSREDPFILNVSGSKFSLGEHFTNYLKWEDKSYEPPIVDSMLNIPSINLFFNQRRDFRNAYPYSFFTDDLIITHPGYSLYTSYTLWASFEDKVKEINNRFNSGTVNNEDVVGYINYLQSYFDIFNINYRLGYPFLPTFNGFSRIEVTYFRQGFPVETLASDIFVAECIPYRSETPIFPYNLLRTLNENRNINPYLGNHTCCDVGFNPSNPREWRYKPEGTICYSSFEIETYYDFMENPLTNISKNLFASLNTFPNYDKFKPLSGVIEPIFPFFDRYIRELIGTCTGDRGNICKPEVFSILKLPYCGDRRPTPFLSGLWDTNWQVKDTGIYSFYEGFYNDGLCVCGNSINGEPMILNTSNSWLNSDKDLYCCFSDINLPPIISDLPCELQSCFEHTIWYRGNIGRTTFNNPKQPGPYCKCGDEILNVNTDPNLYCCKANSLSLSVEPNEAACNI
jgi:hypothetical protein